MSSSGNARAAEEPVAHAKDAGTFQVIRRPALEAVASVADTDMAKLDVLVLDKQPQDDDGQVLEEVCRLRRLSRHTTLMLVDHGGHRSQWLDHVCAGVDVVLKGGRRASDEIATQVARLQENVQGFEYPLSLDTLQLRLLSAHASVELSYSEMAMLRALSSSTVHLLNYDQLAEIFGKNAHYYDRSALAKSVSRLRTKIQSVFGVNLIESVRGYGYRLNRGLIAIQ